MSQLILRITIYSNYAVTEYDKFECNLANFVKTGHFVLVLDMFSLYQTQFITIFIFKLFFPVISNVPAKKKTLHRVQRGINSPNN